MAAVEVGLCGECEVCAAAPEVRVQPDEAADPAPRARGRRRGRRRRTPCLRCGHPLRLHVTDHGAVVAAPLPDDLPAVDAVDEHAPPVAPTTPPPSTEPTTPAVLDTGDTLVDRIRALTELYKAGLLDDDEFAAAKAVVLRDQAV